MTTGNEFEPGNHFRIGGQKTEYCGSSSPWTKPSYSE